MALHFCGCALVFRNIHRRQLRHINTRARLEHIRQRDAKNDRDRSDHFEIKNRFCADTAELLRVADPGNPDNPSGQQTLDGRARVDGVLLVARLALLRRPMLQELHRALEMSPARVLGFVLTSPEDEERSVGMPGYGYYRSPYPSNAPREPVREPMREGDPRA
jgi:hypothetical protein